MSKATKKSGSGWAENKAEELLGIEGDLYGIRRENESTRECILRLLAELHTFRAEKFNHRWAHFRGERYAAEKNGGAQ